MLRAVVQPYLSWLSCVVTYRLASLLRYGLSLLLLFPDNVGRQKILEARSHTLSSYS